MEPSNIGIIKDSGLYGKLNGHDLKFLSLYMLPEWMQEIGGEVEYYPETEYGSVVKLECIGWNCKPPKIRRIR